MEEQRAYLGRDALAPFQRELRQLAPARVFLVRGKASYAACGARDAMEKILAEAGISVFEWSDFRENPRLEDVARGVELFQASGASVLVAVGGGSVLDMAKLVRFAATHEGELTGGCFTRTGDAPVPLFALPTTAGTGCESTPFAVCYKDGVKYSVGHPDMLPDVAVAYPPFTYGNPPYLTACAGFDALAQAVEAYWNIHATPESDHLAEEAIATLWRELPLAVKEPTEACRDCVALASNAAGRAIAITKTTAPHAFSYAFTTHCGYPHGHAVALTFPFFFSLNTLERKDAVLREAVDAPVYAGKMRRLRGVLGLAPADDGCQAWEAYVRDLGLAARGWGGCDLASLVSQVNLQRLGNNPVAVDARLQGELVRYLDSLSKADQK